MNKISTQMKLLCSTVASPTNQDFYGAEVRRLHKKLASPQLDTAAHDFAEDVEAYIGLVSLLNIQGVL